MLRTRVLSNSTCLGDRCEDTCCQNWSMQVDEPTLERYRKDAPELMEAVETSPDSPWIMRKDPASRMCVKLEGGLCGIYKAYGDRFLGDACHFYPRITRNLGEATIMTAALSCPEIVRLALTGDDITATEEVAVERLPTSLKDYLPPELSSAEALAVHHAYLAAAADADVPAERSLLRMAAVSRFLEGVDRKSWPQAVPFYLRNADMQLLPPQVNPVDPFNLLHALCGLIVATHKPPSVRLLETLAAMEKALSVRLDWEKVEIQADESSLAAYAQVQASWRKLATAHAPILRRWLQMQLSMALYPYGGLGRNLPERTVIIGIRLATLKLALMCHAHLYGGELPQEMAVKVIQSLSRFLDHLGDPAFSVQIYEEAGWFQDARLRGLLENPAEFSV